MPSFKQNKIILGRFIAVIALVVGVAFFAPHSTPAMQVSACTWVTTSCGSGCADNKDLYNCSSKVTIKSVSPSTSNPDSNAKAAIVAPPVVQQYVPPAPNIPASTAQQEVTNGNSNGVPVAGTTTAGQVANSSSTYDATNVTINTGVADGVNMSPVNPCLVQSNGVCTQYKYAQTSGSTSGSGGGPTMCPSPTVWCGSNSFTDPSGNSATSPAGCYYINKETCSQKQCTTYTAKVGGSASTQDSGTQDCATEKPIPNPNFVGINGTLPGVNCNGSVCTMTASSTQCQNATATISHCSGGLTNGKCNDNTQSLHQTSVDFGSMPKCGSYQIDFQDNIPGHEGYDACGAATYIAGPPCGSTPVQQGNSTPPQSTPPQSTPTPTPGPMCLNIKMNGTPTLNSSVTFTCGLVNGVNHYEFKVFAPDGTNTTLNASAVGSNVSAPLTITQSGHYSAECRICTGTDVSTCQAYVQ